MSRAERLREAARVLRKRAEAATPGPWEARTVHEGTQWEADDDRLLAQAGAEDPFQPGGGEMGDYGLSINDATYIATMSPVVGLALADALEEAARDFGDYRGLGCPLIVDHLDAVADAILGDHERVEGQ